MALFKKKANPKVVNTHKKETAVGASPPAERQLSAEEKAVEQAARIKTGELTRSEIEELSATQQLQVLTETDQGSPTRLFLKRTVHRLGLADRRVIFTLLAIIIGLLASIAVLAGFGVNGFDVLFFSIGNLFTEQFLFGQWLDYLAVALLMGLSVAIAFKVGIFNIGLPGQMLLSGGLAVLLAQNLGDNGGVINFLIVLVVCMVIGAVVFGVSGLLKSLFNVNEIISTIMLNWLGYYVIRSFFDNGIFVLTPDKTKIMMEHSYDLTLGLDVFGTSTAGLLPIIIAALALVGLFVLFKFTNYGFKQRVISDNPVVAKYSGYNIRSFQISASIISGALAGLAALTLYFVPEGQINVGVEQPLQEGFTGLAIGLVGMGNPVGVLFSALLFSILEGSTSLIVFYQLEIDASLQQIYTSITIYFIAFSTFFIQAWPRYAYKIKEVRRLKRERKEVKQMLHGEKTDLETGKSDYQSPIARNIADSVN